MLNFEELNKLEELKKQLKRSLDVLNYEFSEEELKSIFKEIEKHPVDKRTKTLWQSIVIEKTGVNQFRIYESQEFSDLNYLHKQIQDLLRKK